MKVFLNDKEVQTQEGDNLLAVLTANELAERAGIAVALNQEVVPKNSWANCVLNENDRIMIITATAGG